jgi:hypothetical protein
MITSSATRGMGKGGKKGRKPIQGALISRTHCGLLDFDATNDLGGTAWSTPGSPSPPPLLRMRKPGYLSSNSHPSWTEDSFWGHHFPTSACLLGAQAEQSKESPWEVVTDAGRKWPSVCMRAIHAQDTESSCHRLTLAPLKFNHAPQQIHLSLVFQGSSLSQFLE